MQFYYVKCSTSCILFHLLPTKSLTESCISKAKICLLGNFKHRNIIFTRCVQGQSSLETQLFLELCIIFNWKGIKQWVCYLGQKDQALEGRSQPIKSDYFFSPIGLSIVIIRIYLYMITLRCLYLHMQKYVYKDFWILFEDKEIWTNSPFLIERSCLNFH